jgi:hypothetical protein
MGADAEMSKPLTTYNVTGRIIALAGIHIKAESYEDALERSKELCVTDFIKFKDEHVDSSLNIGSICVDGYWNTDQD